MPGGTDPDPEPEATMSVSTETKARPSSRHPNRSFIDGTRVELSTGAVEHRASTRGQSTWWIALVGAVAYCSWPLAYLVNPSLAGTGLASSFEARSQPFSWLFILLDCVAGLCAVIVCFRVLHPRTRGRTLSRAGVVGLRGYALFGVATAIDAVVPLHCGATSAQACASQLWPMTPDDILTGIAVLALFAGEATVLMITRPPDGPAVVPIAVAVTLAGWCVLGLAVLMGIAVSTSAAALQYAFLTLTSLLAFTIPVSLVSLPPSGISTGSTER